MIAALNKSQSGEYLYLIIKKIYNITISLIIYRYTLIKIYILIKENSSSTAL